MNDNTPAASGAAADDAPDGHENTYEALPEQLRERASWLEKRGHMKDCELMREAAMVIFETRRGLQSLVARRGSNAA